MMVGAMSFPSGSTQASLLAISALVMVAAGAAKFVRPRPTAIALRSVGLRVPVVVIRGFSLFELIVAGDSLVENSVWSRAVLAASYLGLGGFIAVALVRGLPLASCGCFGEPDTPPTVAHLVLNLGLACGALMALSDDAPAPGSVLVRTPGAGAVATIGVAVATACCILVLTTLARVTAEARAATTAVLGSETSRRPS